RGGIVYGATQVAVGVTDAGRLDLDDVGAEVAEHGRRGRAGDEAGQVDDVQTLEERSRGGHGGTFREHGPPARARQADGAAFRRAAALGARELMAGGESLERRYVNSKKTDSPTADGFSAPSTRMS